LTEKQLDLQNSVIIFFILFLILLVLIIRMIFRNVGKPLADFAIAANEIAAGRDAVITVDSSRKDELGSLSVAFRKMIESVQGKEQDLLAHNEELIAQQDELQAQQNEIQATLGMLTENEQKLTRRNELINGISTSLDKEEVLQSIVVSMCKVIRADRGMITFLREDTFASFGISDYGVEQFRENLYSGLVQRLVSTKKAFTVKREQHAMEKGYHETFNYSYDLYLPVLDPFQEVGAIMVFSRYGDPFSEEELTEYETLAIQIAISLEKIKVYEQSEDNRRLNQDILNTVQEGIQLINKDGKIVHINQQLSEIFSNGDSTEEMIGLPWDKWSYIMAGKIEENTFIVSMKEAIKAAAIRPEEEHSFIYRKTDSNQVIKVYCKALQYGENDFGTVLVHRDITKEYEVAQMKTEFVSTVSHELRTPLASVLGFTELMLTKELKPERKTKYLQTIYNEAKRLTSLINDFLDVQRMESGKQTYEKKYIDIHPILQKVIEYLEINTSLHQIELFVASERTLILGDRVKIEQVFTNLLSNSIKYSPIGGKISICIYDSEDMVSIDIQDEGLGIPKEALPNLFQRFYRVDNTDRRRIGGTGLGLSIVEEIVKAHGGRITVSSEYGKGSTFTIHFPKVNMKDEMQSSEGTSSMLSYNIMVVEDDLSLAELLKHELQDSGFRVSYFNSGAKALEQLKIAAPDAIVLDILLEEDEIDGWTIMKEMKESEEWKDIPIFVSTALDEKERGFSLGAQDYLVKPYKSSQLSKIIMHTLLSHESSGQIMVPQQSN
jgi:signal transduction histidine kinase/CheY-like chemotaxis protein